MYVLLQRRQMHYDLLAICLKQPLTKHNNSFGDIFSKRQDKENRLWNPLMNQCRIIFETEVFKILYHISCDINVVGWKDVYQIFNNHLTDSLIPSAFNNADAAELIDFFMRLLA